MVSQFNSLFVHRLSVKVEVKVEAEEPSSSADGATLSAHRPSAGVFTAAARITSAKSLPAKLIKKEKPASWNPIHQLSLLSLLLCQACTTTWKMWLSIVKPPKAILTAQWKCTRSLLCSWEWPFIHPVWRSCILTQFESIQCGACLWMWKSKKIWFH